MHRVPVTCIQQSVWMIHRTYPNISPWGTMEADRGLLPASNSHDIGGRGLARRGAGNSAHYHHRAKGNACSVWRRSCRFEKFRCDGCRILRLQLSLLQEILTHLASPACAEQQGAIVYNDWPILGDVSVYAAKSALAARWQGKYLIAHDALINGPRLAENGQVDAVL